MVGLGTLATPSSSEGLAARLGLTAIVPALSSPVAVLTPAKKALASPGAAPLVPLLVVGSAFEGDCGVRVAVPVPPVWAMVAVSGLPAESVIRTLPLLTLAEKVVAPSCVLMALTMPVTGLPAMP